MSMLLPTAACGLMSDESPQTQGSTTDEVPEIAKMVPESVREQGYLDVASEIYAPAVIAPAGGGEPTGWEIEQTRAIAEVMGLKARFTIVPFDSIVPGLQGGRWQAAAGEIIATPERAKVVDFVVNHVSSDALLVKAGSDIAADSEEDLCGLTITVQLGSFEADYASKIARRCEESGKPTEVKTFQEQAAVNLAVSRGRADAGLGAASQVAYVADQAEGTFEVVELDWAPDFYTGLVLARNEDSGQLAQAAAAATDHLIEEGVIQDILDEFNGGLGAIDKARIVPPPAS